MGLKGCLRRLRKAAQGQLNSFELADGSRCWFHPEEAWVTLFRYWSESLRAVYHQTPRPEPPEILEVVARARDRESAFRQIYAQAPAPWCPLDVEALIERGELVPRPLVVGRAQTLQ